MLTSLHLHMKSRRVCIKARSPPASLPLKGQVTRHTTVKWPIGVEVFNPRFKGNTVTDCDSSLKRILRHWPDAQISALPFHAPICQIPEIPHDSRL